MLLFLIIKEANQKRKLKSKLQTSKQPKLTMSSLTTEAKRIKNRDAVRRCRANKKQEYERAQARLRQVLEPPRYVINNDMLAEAILHLNHHQSPVPRPQSVIPESKESIYIPSNPMLVREMAIQTEIKIEEAKIDAPIVDVEYAKRVIAKAEENRMKERDRKRASRAKLKERDIGAYLNIQRDYKARKKAEEQRCLALLAHSSDI